MLVFCVLLVGAAPIDPDLAALRSTDARLTGVAYRLQTANAALCPNREPVTGVALQTLSQFPRSQHERIGAQLGLGRFVAIAAVAPDSPATRAGLQVGDALVAIDGVATPVVAAGTESFAPVSATEAMLAEALARNPGVLLTVERGGQRSNIRLGKAQGCASRFQSVPGGYGKTGADGTTVQISDDMLALAQSDDEVAVVVAHELAHNILMHKAKRTPSKQAEYEADRLGVWLHVRAGYDPAALVRFWTRLKARTDSGIFSDGTHPAWNKRITAVAAALEELNKQRTAGRPLVPDGFVLAQQSSSHR